jgi:Protein of Unknown function (DUF2604)
VTRKERNMPPATPIDLVIVVNGQPIPLSANPNQPLQSLIGRALAESGNAGQPPQNWELRDESGNLLDVSAKIATFGFAPGTRLFLNLKAGVGGS